MQDSLFVDLLLNVLPISVGIQIQCGLSFTPPGLYTIRSGVMYSKANSVLADAPYSDCSVVLNIDFSSSFFPAHGLLALHTDNFRLLGPHCILIVICLAFYQDKTVIGYSQLCGSPAWPNVYHISCNISWMSKGSSPGK